MTELNERLNGRDFMMDAAMSQLVSVTGLIGVGKTTLATALAECLDATLVQEEFSKNPYLAQAYDGQRDAALDSEIFFLSSSASQLTEGKLEAGRLYVNDYMFDKALVYAAQWLNDQQMGEYLRIYRSVCEKVVPPTLVIFIDDTVEHCLERIKQRNRGYEQHIDRAFLQQQLDGYQKVLVGWTACPVLRIRANECYHQGDVQRLAEEVRAYLPVM